MRLWLPHSFVRTCLETVYCLLVNGIRGVWLLGHVGCDVERWRRTDPAFVDGTHAHLVFKSAWAGELPKQSKIEEDRKLIFFGSIGQCGTTAMCGLRLDPFICLRVTAWLQAFHKNAASFDRMYASVCQRIRSRHLRNGFHFKRTPWQNWMLTRAELVVIRPSDAGTGFWVEPRHQDGGQSVFHMGLTLAGRRKLICYQDGLGPDLELHNYPGVVYFGSLTGPEHEVFHEEACADDMMTLPGFGSCSVSVMFRTALFPYYRSRTRKRVPDPRQFVHLVQKAARVRFQGHGFELPSLDECLAFDTTHVPVDEPVAPATLAFSDSVHEDVRVPGSPGSCREPIPKRFRVRVKSRPPAVSGV